jgi:hypothetical protein
MYIGKHLCSPIGGNSMNTWLKHSLYSVRTEKSAFSYKTILPQER